MATIKKSAKSGTKEVKQRRRPPAISPEERENELIALAMEKAEEKLRNGTASSQLICHFLKLGSSREAKEQAFLEKRTENLSAKTESIYSAQNAEELYAQALAAMRMYNGQANEEDIQ